MRHPRRRGGIEGEFAARTALRPENVRNPAGQHPAPTQRFFGFRASLVVLTLFAAQHVFGQAGFTWDFNSYSAGGWTANGDTTFASSSGGSLIWPNTVSGASADDYELDTTIFPGGGGGTYVHFLHASSTSVMPGAGSYISVEVTPASNWQSGGMATLAINQWVSGSVTQLSAASIALRSGDMLRSVVFGTNLWVFINNTRYVYTIPAGSGKPGFGGYSLPSGSYFTNIVTGTGSIRVGHHDTSSPQAIVAASVATSLRPTIVSMRWQGAADDSAGIGIYGYIVSRPGLSNATIIGPEYSDATALAATTYTYTIQALDFHGNLGPSTNITITTPPTGAVDPRRTGLLSTGSYWGGGGEQIDTLSGNLHFTIPLASAQGRTGWTVPVNLVYDSQNWLNDHGVNWNLGADVGYGYGWKALIGAVTPYYTAAGVDHYVYTDGTGAQYRLTNNAGGVWTTQNQAAYVWLDTNVSPARLHFADGKFWVLGCTSGGTEQDAGTMYPTIIEDTNGNQVIVTYDSGLDLPFSQSPNPTTGYVWTVTQNTSSRIIAIEDSRAQPCFNFYLPTYNIIPCHANATGSSILYDTSLLSG